MNSLFQALFGPLLSGGAPAHDREMAPIRFDLTINRRLTDFTLVLRMAGRNAVVSDSSDANR